MTYGRSSLSKERTSNVPDVRVPARALPQASRVFSSEVKRSSQFVCSPTKANRSWAMPLAGPRVYTSRKRDYCTLTHPSAFQEEFTLSVNPRNPNGLERERGFRCDATGTNDSPQPLQTDSANGQTLATLFFRRSWGRLCSSRRRVYSRRSNVLREFRIRSILHSAKIGQRLTVTPPNASKRRQNPSRTVTTDRESESLEGGSLGKSTLTTGLRGFESLIANMQSGLGVVWQKYSKLETCTVCLIPNPDEIV